VNGAQLSSTPSHGVGRQILSLDTIFPLLPCASAALIQFLSATPDKFCKTNASATRLVGDAFSPYFCGTGIPLLSSYQCPASWKLVQDPSGEPGEPRCGH
jgi:hypothetical protein